MCGACAGERRNFDSIGAGVTGAPRPGPFKATDVQGVPGERRTIDSLGKTRTSALMALAKLLPQLRPLDYQGAQNRDESTGGADAGQETSGAKYLSKSDGNGVMAEHNKACGESQPWLVSRFKASSRLDRSTPFKPCAYSPGGI